MMTFRLAVLILAVLPSAASCARAGAESRHDGKTAREWVVALAGDDPWKMSEAMTALEAMGQAAVPAPLAGVSHEDQRVRRDSARVLGETGGPGAGRALAGMVERDAVYMNRFFAAGALSQLTAAGDLEARDAAAALVPKLAPRVESADFETAHDTADLLGRLGEPARDTLMAKLAHPRPQVRIVAILALDSLKTGVVPALAKAADDPEGQVRAAAVTQLGKLAMWGEPDSAAGIPVIKSKLKDVDPAVRDAAALALKNAKAH
jgi:HEAT repeat protein